MTHPLWHHTRSSARSRVHCCSKLITQDGAFSPLLMLSFLPGMLHPTILFLPPPSHQGCRESCVPWSAHPNTFFSVLLVPHTDLWCCPHTSPHPPTTNTPHLHPIQFWPPILQTGRLRFRGGSGTYARIYSKLRQKLSGNNCANCHQQVVSAKMAE